MSREQAAWVIPASIVSSLLVGIAWTALTGTLWQWVPIGLGISIIILMSKRIP